MNLKMGSSYREAGEFADKALFFDPGFLKARYRRAMARKGLGFLDASITGEVNVLACNE
jgi:hypothetical protein